MTAATITAQKMNLSMVGMIGYLWETMDGDDVGQVVKLPPYKSLTVQLGAGGGNTHGSSTTVMQGSNDPLAESDPANAVWFTLTEKDTASTAISRTTTAILKEVKEHPLYIRPSQSGGTAADIDVIAIAR
jgi:hypothetical protein